MNIGQKRAVWIFSFKRVTMVFVSNNIHRPKLSIKNFHVGALHIILFSLLALP